MKKLTKHILLLALMLFGAIGTSWADNPARKIKGPINLTQVDEGDTLVDGFTITGPISDYCGLFFKSNTYKKNGILQTVNSSISGTEFGNLVYGLNGTITLGGDTYTPVDGSADGNAWVVTFTGSGSVYIAGAFVDFTIPEKDNLTGNWTFLMPGANKLLNVQLYDSIVLGPNVNYVTADPVIPPANRYTRGDSTILYYDPANLNYITFAAVNPTGKVFSDWADITDQTDPYRTLAMRELLAADIVNGNRYIANFSELYTLTLNANQGGTLTLDGYTPASVNGWTINVSNIGATGGDEMPIVSDFQITTVTLLASNNEVVGSGNLNAASGTIQIQTSGTATQVRFGFSWHNNEYNEDYGDIITASVSAVSGQQLYEEGDLLAVTANFTCTPDVTPAVTPFGITANNNGSFNVMEGLTVNVTATPDSAHYLSAINGHDTVGNYATGYSFTMPSANHTLAANFTQKPVLTLASNEGGTLEAIVPPAEPVLLTTIIPTATAISTGTQTNDTVTVTVAGDLQWGSGGWIVQYDNGKHGSVSVTAAAGFDIAYYKFYFSTGTYIVSEETAAVYPFCSGSSQKIYTQPNGQGQSIGYDAVTRIEVYTPTHPNAIASSTPNTYIIDYGTDITVKATPDATHYLANFDGTDVRNDNDTAVKTYTEVTDPFTSTAHFAAKPQLILTANDGGTLTLDGYSPAGLGTEQLTVPGNWSGNWDNVLTSDMPNDFQTVDYFVAGAWQNTTGKDVRLIFDEEDGQAVCFPFNADGTKDSSGKPFKLNLASHVANGGLVLYTTGVHTEVLPAGVVSANATLDTFVVDYGTTLTVTATPDSIHYLATLGGVTMGSNTAKDTTFAVTATTNLAANFAQKPTLTLAHNDGGTLEAIVPQSEATAMHLTTDQIPTWPEVFEPVMEADLQPFGFVAVDSAAAAAWTGAPASGQVLLFYAPAGNSFKAILFQNGQWHDAYNAGFFKADFYTNSDIFYFTTGATAANVIASSTPNTYYIDYNTSVTVKATPSDTAYLVRFVGDADTNSNVAVEKTYGPLTAALTTAEATFNDKPVLTLAVNDTTWGNVSVSGPVVWNNQIWGSWNMISTSFPQTIGDITISKNNFYCYNSSGKLLLSRSVDNNSHVTFTSAGDNFTRIEMTYTGGSNLEPANEWTCENGVAVWEGDAQSVTITNATDFYFTQIKFIRGSGIAQLTDTTYRVDYGTTLTVQAKATELHHVANWVDADSVAYPVDNIAYFNYFATEPDSLFPDSSTLTFTVTADTMAKAIFGINYRNLVFSHNDGGHMEFVVNYDSIAFSGISTTSVTGGDITITADQADEDGMYLRNETGNINIAIEGGASITQVDFHITNGSNLVNTISTNAQGATITTTDNNEYGSIKNLNTPNLTISSSTTHDLQIDQFIVHYGNALPAGVAVGPNDSTWYVMPDSTVKVRAIPDEGHYLISLASAPDTIRILDTLTVEMTVTTDDTLKAVFAPNPVITLAVNDENGGSVYFTGYHGNTITRAGIIKAQSVEGSYQWYEAGEIMSIEGGNGMVTKDEATSHYLTVSGVFDGTATVVTSAGAFSITSYPTLPNGVRYNIADDNYTINPYTELSFTATPNPNYYFVNWAKVTLNDTLGVDSALISTEAVTTVRIDKDMKLQGNFLHNPYVLTLVADANMGTAMVAPYVSYGETPIWEMNPDGTYTVMADSTVTIVASANTGYHITGWQNAQGNQANLTNDTVSITIVSDTTITVNLAGNPVVTLAANGNGAMTVDSLPDYAVDNQNGTYSVLPGTVLNIVSTPDTHYYMTRWNDVDSMINSNVAVTRTDTINADITIGASFAHKPILTLTVNDNNSGSVTLESAGSSGSGSGEPVDVTIGYSINTTYVTPYQSLWGYSFVESLYTAEEIGTAGTITSISYNLKEDNQPQTNNFVIYMKNVSRNTFANNTDYEPVTDADIVYSGTVTFNPGWTTITLGTPFEYDGTSNLMIAFDENTNGYSTRYFYYTENDDKVVSYHDDNHNPDPYNLGSFTGDSYVSPKRAIIKLDITPSTGMPAGVAPLTDTTYVVDYNIDVIMKANAKTGYNFLRWEGPNGQVYGTDSVLTISPMVTDTLVHAVFDTNRYNLVVNVDSASTGFGTATGSVSEARHFEEYTIEATADSGYHFVVWSDGDSNASRTVTLTSDSTFTATFDTNTYNLNVVVAEACTGFGTVTGDTIAKHFLTYDISATANPGYHFVMWSDGDSNATRTVELVSDSTIEAIFEFNPSLTLVYRENNGDMKFVVESQTETFTGISTNELSAGAISVNATSADATYGMSLKNNTVTITASGDNVIKQVAFHLTNGVNRAETITATPADTLVVTNGNAYGTITSINSNSVTISSTSTKDINIDQLTIQYAPVLPAGVVHLDEDEDTVYRLVPGTVVQVMAIPFEGNYLLSWDGDTTSTDDLIATVTMADSDLVVIANFSGDPVMTLTSKGEGRIYFESYSGYTINRDETILMTNYVFNGQNPYTWYEAGEIYEINDPSGMVTYDTATKHYISVHGQFTGTATVVTTSGSFAVTCIPTVPNGVTVMREGMYIIQPGTEVTVVAEPAEEHYLYSWDDITTTENVRDITVTRDTNIVVNFLHRPYKLALVSDSAMGTVAPADGQAFVTANDDGTYTVMADSTVTLVATPSAGFHLTGWSNVDTTDLTIDVKMISDSTVTAYFDTTHAELAWDTNAFTGYTLIDFNAYKPTLANPNGVEVRYGLVGADSNSTVVVSADSCIISNPMGGVITTAGTYTVYAVHDLTQEYFYDSVTYDLTVKNGAIIALMKNINNGGSIEFVNTEADLTHAYSVTDNANIAFLAPGAGFRAVATANEGYHLEGWQTGSIENGFEDFATGDTVLYTAPDTINARIYFSGLRAQFDTNHYVLVARAMDSCNGCGIVTGTDSAARHFVDYTLVATADPCYHFVGWTDTLGNEVSTSNTMVVSPVSDSILVAHFELNIYAGDTTVDVCDQFTWHDSTYTVTPSVAPTFIYKTANNCDSLVTLNLTIRHSTNSDTTAVVCDVMNWYEHQNITGSCDTLKHTFVGGNTAQCDSTLTLKLTVKYSSNSVLDTTVCEEFTWTNNTTYYRSTIAHDTTLNVAGCDSIAYLDLKVNYPSSSEQTVVTCDSVYRWNGFVYTTSTIGIFHTKNVYRCDSTATLNLTLNHAFTGYDVQEACVSYPWIDGNTYSTSQLDSSVTYTYAGGAANGCDSTVILLLTINQPVSTTETVTACDSYTWHGTTYTSSTSPTSMPSYPSTGSNGCDSITYLDLTINNSVTSQFAAQTCSYYIWDGTYYDSTGTYTRTYSAANSCDSVVTMTLTVNSTITSSFDTTACGSYTWNNVEYAASGAYSHTYQSVYGCDSVVTMRLTLKQPVTTTLTATACNSYEWNGQTYQNTGTYFTTMTGANGCDSTTTLQLTILTTGTSTDNVTACDSYTWINGVTYYETPAVAPTDTVATDNCITLVTLNLTINNSVTSQFDTAACNSYVWDGTFYNQSGSYNKSYSGANSCDSTVTMNLTIKQPTTATVSATSCDSYEWNGVTYQNTGTYFATTTGSNGCDSTTTLQLTINQSGTTSETVTACDEYLWNGETYQNTGTYVANMTGTNGCNIVATLNLTINNSTSSQFSATACNYYIWNGSYYDSTAVYSRTYRAANGCDSVVTLDLTVNTPVDTTINVSSCGSYTWNNVEYAASGAYTKTYRGANGCDSVVTINLTVKQPVTAIESVTACDSYTWHGTTYTSSTSSTSRPSYTSTGSNDCDSITYLDLTISNSGTATETATACNEYEWRGTTYNVSGSYNDTTIGTNNCTLVTTLNLTIKNSTEATETVTACESYNWHGETYRNTGTYFATMTGSNGCDSTTYLNLTVNHGTSSQTDATACDSYSWNGMNYTVSGTYTFDTVNSLGCDSTATLNLTVNYRTTATEIVTACDSYTWHGETYRNTGTYFATMTGANGCDSTTTLQLTIATTGTSTANITACDSLTWINGVTYYETPAVAPTYTVTGETCNTIVTLNLTINNSVETSFDTAACNYYIWAGNYYNNSGSYTKSYTAANGCDSVVTMALTVNHPVSSRISETVCGSYTWNNVVYTVSGVYTQVFTGSNGCDSTVTLALTVNQPRTTVLTATACDSYTWNGVTYQNTGTYFATTTGSNGCDSTTTLQLTINQSTTATETVTACDSYTWHGVTYTASGSYDYTTTGANGCAMVTTLNLTVNESATGAVDTTVCGNYIWAGTYYAASGVYNKTYAAANGCDSVVTLTLTVNQPVSSSFSESACQSYTWNNVEYAASGVYTQTFNGSNGCDSVVTLTLNIKQPVTVTVSQTACDSYTWNGVTYQNTGTYFVTMTGSNGCDSTTTLYLTINQTTTATETVVACDSYTWHGQTYQNTGTYFATMTGANGCDLVTTLNLTINNSVANNVSATACNYYIWDGSYYANSGVYVKSYTALNGCDSVVTMTLTVNQPVTATETVTACDSYTWNGQTYQNTGTYFATTTGSNGCDSTTTLHLTVNQSTTAVETVSACGSYTWHGTTYTSSTSTPSYTSTGSNGCDSITYLHLTINNPVHTAETMAACESYTWNGTAYTASGDYTYSHNDANGCVQVDTLHLTINNPVHTAETMVACGSYIWHGTAYVVTGDYTFSHADANGCIQVDTLHLTVGNSVVVNETVTTCDSYEWNGRVYTENGEYTYSTTTVNGCDSTVILHLTVNHSATSSFDTLAYGSFTWNGQTYTESGAYEQTLTTVNGCDSVVTLNLVILPEGFVMPYLYNLMDVMLSVNHNEEGAENVHYIWYRWYRNGELVLEGPNYDSYSENGNRLNGCYYLEVAVDESMQYWVRSNEVCINGVGIENVENVEITLAPNPVRQGGMVKVSADGADLQGAELRVFDLQGRMVLEQKDNAVFMAPSATGMYMVRLTLSDGRKVVSKLIVK